MAQSSGVTQVSGVVEAINQSGFKLQNGNWLNYSQYGYRGPAGGLPAPAVGQMITAHVKNDKFINSLSIADGAGTLTQPVAPPPAQAQEVKQAVDTKVQAGIQAIQAMVAQDNQTDRIIETTIKTRLELLKVLAIAQPNSFVLDQLETLTETVKNLETFVLEDLIASATPVDDDEDVDLIEEEAI